MQGSAWQVKLSKAKLQDKAEGSTNQDKVVQDRRRQYKAVEGSTRQVKVREDRRRQYTAGQGW